MNPLYKLVGRASMWVNLLAIVFLMAIIALICVDVILRIFGMAILGAYELTRVFVALLVSFGLAYTQLKKGHILTDLFLVRFPKRVRKIISTINLFLAVVFYALVTWQLFKFAGKLIKTGQIVEQVELPLFPVMYGVAFGCLLLFLMLLGDFLQSFKKEG